MTLMNLVHTISFDPGVNIEVFSSVQYDDNDNPIYIGNINDSVPGKKVAVEFSDYIVEDITLHSAKQIFVFICSPAVFIAKRRFGSR